MRKPKVGETLWLADSGNRARHNPEQRPCTVVKVGRKYFAVEYGVGHKYKVEFHINSWGQKTNYCQDYALYETEQEWRDKREKDQWSNVYGEAFGTWGRKDFTLEQYRKAAEILGLKLEDK